MAEEAFRGQVLVVDDDRSLLAIMSGILGTDYAVSTATSGAEALQLLETTSIDLVLLDIMMPEMDGIEVCAAIKAIPKSEEIPIIFLTSMEGEEAEVAALDAGAVDYLHKPVNPRIVESRVRMHIQNYLYLQFLERMLREKSSTLESLREESRALLESIGLDKTR